MANLSYTAIASLDGYIEDEEGKFDWAAPDEEVHAFVNDLERPVGTHLYGRRMYETMVWWETGDHAAVYGDYAEIWRAAEKVVYSRKLQTVSSERTRIEREFDAAAIRRLKESSRSDISIGGAELAGQAIAEGERVMRPTRFCCRLGPVFGALSGPLPAPPRCQPWSVWSCCFGS